MERGEVGVPVLCSESAKGKGDGNVVEGEGFAGWGMGLGGGRDGESLGGHR